MDRKLISFSLGASGEGTIREGSGFLCGSMCFGFSSLDALMLYYPVVWPLVRLRL